jgi:TPR repeat protein
VNQDLTAADSWQERALHAVASEAVRQAYEAVANMLRSAVQEDNARAAYLLSTLLQPDFVPIKAPLVSDAESPALLQKAADLGYPRARFDLCLEYKYGNHVKRDVEKGY